jgi:hypothetical protein
MSKQKTTKGTTKAAETMTAAEKSKKERAKRVEFTKVCDKDMLNEEGKLTAVPENHDAKKHLPLRKSDFAEETLFFDFRANELEVRGNATLALAKKMREQSATFKKFGDPKKRAQVKRAQRMVEQLAKLKEQLSAEGVDVDAILEDASEA